MIDDNTLTENEETPFDRLNLPQKDTLFKQRLRQLYNDVATSDENWDDLVEQLDVDSRPYIKGYIFSQLSLPSIAVNIGKTYQTPKPLRVLDKLSAIWEESKNQNTGEHTASQSHTQNQNQRRLIA